MPRISADILILCKSVCWWLVGAAVATVAAERLAEEGVTLQAVLVVQALPAWTLMITLFTPALAVERRIMADISEITITARW